MITSEFLQAENAFWGNPDNIAWFREEPVPPYWDTFFQEASRIEINHVLDLGCGAGRIADMLEKYNYDLAACDFNIEMVKETIKRLTNKYPNIAWPTKIVQASMTALPYLSNHFDAVISNGVYHNAWSREELERAVNETARVLRPHGYVCFNLFTSGFVASDLEPLPNMKDLFVTSEGLRMVLISKDDFLDIAQHNGFHIASEIVEYQRQVTTGRRHIVRGILRKN